MQEDNNSFAQYVQNDKWYVQVYRDHNVIDVCNKETKMRITIDLDDLYKKTCKRHGR